MTYVRFSAGGRTWNVTDKTYAGQFPIAYNHLANISREDQKKGAGEPAPVPSPIAIISSNIIIPLFDDDQLANLIAHGRRHLPQVNSGYDFLSISADHIPGFVRCFI